MRKERCIQIFYFIFALILALSVPLFGVEAASQPVGYWSFDDSISDLKVEDFSINNNVGTVEGGVMQKTGSACVKEECVEFDGTSGKITVADSAALDFGTVNFSISLWIKIAKRGAKPEVVIDKLSTAGYKVFFPSSPPVDVGKIMFYLYNGSTFVQDVLDKPIDDGKWHFIAIAINRVNQKVFGYIDGVGQKWKTANSMAKAIPDGFGSLDNNENLFIGAKPNDFFGGFLDEVKLFNAALTQADVTALFEEGAVGVGASCGSDTDCTDKPGGSSNLECVKAGAGRACVPKPNTRKVGTWCNLADHCNTGEGFLKLSCDKDKRMCVVASSGISCADKEVNSDPLLGKILSDVDTFARCDEGFFCNSKFVCQTDVGGAFAQEVSGIGGTTEDIRDQVRSIINIALGFLGVAGVIITIYGGTLWMTAMGEEEKVEKGRKTIIAGLIGIVVIGIAWSIVSFVLSATQKVGG